MTVDVEDESSGSPMTLAMEGECPTLCLGSCTSVKHEAIGGIWIPVHRHGSFPKNDCTAGSQGDASTVRSRYLNCVRSLGVYTRHASSIMSSGMYEDSMETQSNTDRYSSPRDHSNAANLNTAGVRQGSSSPKAYNPSIMPVKAAPTSGSRVMMSVLTDPTHVASSLFEIPELTS
jgi:hypothetical protein